MPNSPVKCYGLIGENGVEIIDNEFVCIRVGEQRVEFTAEAATELAKQLALAAAQIS